MKQIEVLTDYIEEELEGAQSYMKKALEYKESKPELANMFYRMTNDKMTHIDMLHKNVMEHLAEHKRMNGTNAAAMEEAYNLLHKRHIAREEKITNMQNLYKR